MPDLRFRYKLSFQDLAKLSGRHQIVAVNSAGLANQLRCILGIVVRGHIPLINKHPEQQRKVEATEGIHIDQILRGVPTTMQKRFQLRYNDWALQLPVLAGDDAELFNSLNWYGLINASTLTRMKHKTAIYRAAFDSLQPAVKRSDIPKSISDTLGVHMRMFGRNYVPSFRVENIGSEYVGRYYSKQAWSEERLATLLDMVLLVSQRGDTLSVYTDDPNHPVVKEFIDLAGRDGRDAFVVRSPASLSHSEQALYELVSRKRHGVTLRGEA